jgi:hypothetical protein
MHIAHRLNEFICLTRFENISIGARLKQPSHMGRHHKP